MSGGGTRSGRRRTGGSSGLSAKPNTEIDGINGIPQSQIDSLRGTRGHLKKGTGHSVDIMLDYMHVGINRSNNEFLEIYNAIRDYSAGEDQLMRGAALKYVKGEKLNSTEQKYFDKFQKVVEYTKVAPTYNTKSVKYLYRGISGNESEYTKSILSLKPGDVCDFSKVTSSFSTSKDYANMFAEMTSTNGKGIIFRIPTSKIKNATSITHFAKHTEAEVLVSDFDWKVKKIVHNPNNYAIAEIILE